MLYLADWERCPLLFVCLFVFRGHLPLKWFHYYKWARIRLLCGTDVICTSFLWSGDVEVLGERWEKRRAEIKQYTWHVDLNLPLAGISTFACFSTGTIKDFPRHQVVLDQRKTFSVLIFVSRNLWTPWYPTEKLLTLHLRSVYFSKQTWILYKVQRLPV